MATTLGQRIASAVTRNTRLLATRVNHTNAAHFGVPTHVFGSSTRYFSAKTVPFTYVSPEGEEREVQAEIGMNLLDVAHANDIELEGACGGELACATCHLIFEKDIYESLPEKIDEEDDMLDLAFSLTETSRLGCQICTTENFAGMKVKIPAED